jgi:HD-like signal output (HDOD) protein
MNTSLKVQCIKYSVTYNKGSKTLKLNQQLQKALNLMQGKKVIQLPPELLRLNELLNQSELPDRNEVADLIQTNLPLTAKVLETANSSKFSFAQGEIQSISQAIDALGMINLHRLVIASGVSLQMQSFDQQEVQEHALESAQLCRLIAGHTQFFTPEEAYLLGLIHNIGAFFLSSIDPEYEPLFFETFDHPYSVIKQEYQRYQTSHPIIGLAIVRNWGLPKRLPKIITFHHQKNYLDMADDEIKEGIAMIQLANFLASEVRFGEHLSEETMLEKEQALTYFQMGQETLETIRTKFLANQIED